MSMRRETSASRAISEVGKGCHRHWGELRFLSRGRTLGNSEPVQTPVLTQLWAERGIAHCFKGFGELRRWSQSGEAHLEKLHQVRLVVRRELGNHADVQQH